MSVRSARPDIAKLQSLRSVKREPIASALSTGFIIEVVQQIIIRSVSKAVTESLTFCSIAPAQMQLCLLGDS
jgi:hypothetical protein